MYIAVFREQPKQLQKQPTVTISSIPPPAVDLKHNNAMNIFLEDTNHKYNNINIMETKVGGNVIHSKKLIEQERDIDEFLNKTLGMKIDSEAVEEIGTKNEGKNVDKNELKEKLENDIIIDNDDDSSNIDTVIKELMNTNKDLENKLLYQNRIIDDLNAGIVEKEFALRYTRRVNDEKEKNNVDLKFMMDDLEETLKSVVDTNETSERARKLMNDFMAINNEINITPKRINNQTNVSPIYLSPPNTSYSSSSSSSGGSMTNSSITTSGGSHEKQMMAINRSIENVHSSSTFNNETVTSIILPAMLIDENDFADKVYNSPPPAEEATGKNNNMMKLGIRGSSSSSDDGNTTAVNNDRSGGEEIWV